MFAHGSRSRLTGKDLGRFAGRSLLDRVGRAMCGAGCLPRRELFEAWETARRTRRLLRGYRIVDVAGGHGMLAHLLLLLDDSSPSAVVVDPAVPPSHRAIAAAFADGWPRLAGRVRYAPQPLDRFAIRAGDLVVSCHACGALTDRVLEAAMAARTPVVVLPCCHDFATCDRGPLAGWMDGVLAIDAVRALRLQQAGYDVRTQTLPREITAKNRLLLAYPSPLERISRAATLLADEV